jgi:hypothetical protein
MVKNQRLPENMLTPTTKAEDHDAPVSPQEVSIEMKRSLSWLAVSVLGSRLVDECMHALLDQVQAICCVPSGQHWAYVVNRTALWPLIIYTMQAANPSVWAFIRQPPRRRFPPLTSLSCIILHDEDNPVCRAGLDLP